jgi:hypothetical protein
MKGTLHLILGTPNSERRSILSQANTPENPSYLFLLPKELQMEDSLCSEWEWSQEQFEFADFPEVPVDEFFLFFSKEYNLANQFEATLQLLEKEQELVVGRVILFINSDLLTDASDQVFAWIDGAGHFADAICFTHRKNANAAAISKCKERFETMRYPLETYVVGSKKPPSIVRILAPIHRRISHIFDPPDLLDPEDYPQNDPYLARLPNGRRERSIPSPFCS